MKTITRWIWGGTLSCSLIAQAGTVQFAQFFPWDVVESQWQAQSLNQTFSQDRLDLTFKEWRPYALGISAQMQGQLQRPSFHADGFVATASGLSLQVRIAQVGIEQTIIKVIAGNTVRIRVQATCQNLHLLIPAIDARVSATFVDDELGPHPLLNNVQLSFPQNWQLDAFECSGIGGVGDDLKSSLEAALKAPDSWTPLLTQWLSGQLSPLWSAQWEKLTHALSGQVSDLKLAAPSDEGLTVWGKLATGGKADVPLSTLPHLSRNTPQLVLPLAGLEAIAADKLADAIPSPYNLQNISSFRSLMSSRLAQQIAWPDLLRFPTSAPFNVLVDHADTVVKLSGLNSSAPKAQIQARGHIQTEVRGAPIYYFDWSTFIDTGLKIGLTQGQLSLSTSSPQTQLNLNFSPGYFLIFRPNQTIPTSTLGSAFKSMVKAQSALVPLPTLTLQEHVWMIQSWHTDGDDMVMEWQP